ncbi:hypothetical protein Bca4012_088227 [Brassica carinata]|uniref:Uncharacterized protein n=1 Tax=Brassica oleracea var. oleracea TaxID=109376 RepID=A0A0D3A6P1_BRAOL
MSTSFSNHKALCRPTCLQVSQTTRLCAVLHVYKFLMPQVFVSSYDIAHRYRDSEAYKYLLGRTSLTAEDAFDFLKKTTMMRRIGNLTLCEQRDTQDKEANGNQEQAVGFSVKNTVLFPSEVEKVSLETYCLSDEARLTVVFSPIRMPCSGAPNWFHDKTLNNKPLSSYN